MSSTLLQDLAVILLISGVVALVFHRLGQPKLIGYVLAGLIIGPFTPPFSLIRDEHTIRTLADIGIVFLMFSLGLDFNLRRLRRVGATALVTAILDVGVMLWLGYLLGRAFGWSPLQSIFLGAILCDSSTTILAKLLRDMGRTHTRFAGLAVGITVVEDVLAVVLIAVLTGLAATGSVQTGAVALRLWELAMFIILVVIAGLLTIPRAFDYVQRLRNDELMVVTVVGLCFGVALLAVKLELSLALGAVLAGAVVSESRALRRISDLTDPLSHVFSAVFFVTIGIQLNPASLARHIGPIAAASALVIVGKFINTSVGAAIMGHRLDTALLTGAGLAQVGEFAFIIAALSVSLDVGGDELYQIGVAVAVITTLTNGYLIRGTDRALVWLRRSPRWQRWDEALRFYGRWTEPIVRQGAHSAVRKAVRRSVALIVVNLLLISAVFGIAAYAARKIGQVGAMESIPAEWTAALLWLGAAILSLPLYVVTFRKLNALAMMLAETALPIHLRGAWPAHVRTFMTRVITLAGAAAMVLLTYMLSSTLLPSRESFGLLFLLTLAGGIWARHTLSKLYARAESALHSRLTESPRAPNSEAARPIPENLAGEINVQSVVICARPGAKREHTLRTLNVRNRTGTTIVALERGSERITNPDPDMLLHEGDRVYVLGTADQIQSARKLLDAAHA